MRMMSNLLVEVIGEAIPLDRRRVVIRLSGLDERQGDDDQVVLGRIQCISVGPEQDWTGKSGSRMGSSKSEMVEDAFKTVARKGHCLFDEGTKTLFAPQNIKIDIETMMNAVGGNRSNIIKQSVIEYMISLLLLFSGNGDTYDECTPLDVSKDSMVASDNLNEVWVDCKA